MTARAVADLAGVSQGLIRHHYGSMAGCCRPATSTSPTRSARASAMRSARRPASTRSPPSVPRARAHRRVPRCATLRAERPPRRAGRRAHRRRDRLPRRRGGAGVLTATADEHRRAAMLTIFSLGAVSLHRHLARHLGVDLSSPDFAVGDAYLEYVRIQLEVFASVFNPAVLEEYRGYLDSLEDES
ncbi:hypothetical protein G7085_16015 [Tessaracoccus sp. HDW20]|uniref:hypothetical protein n=1 Tax=Tessaracoccus coleopterorum TaxID=2714950 RepID=UPI0018D45B6F|nr:hypothetical protein [Tessaracoccus coleopterorum]NHB85595.1 hypothetical protein [Tessaracoccus coleopterorum]